MHTQAARGKTWWDGKVGNIGACSKISAPYVAQLQIFYSVGCGCIHTTVFEVNVKQGRNVRVPKCSTITVAYALYNFAQSLLRLLRLARNSGLFTC